MRWHKEERKQHHMLRHPTDGSQWRNVDREFPDFDNDLRNIRFGLSTDGKNPFGEWGSSHSTWPVWPFVCSTFLLGYAWRGSIYWCWCLFRAGNNLAMILMCTKTIGWWTFIVVEERRCTCVGRVQTGKFRPMSIAFRNHQRLACT